MGGTVCAGLVQSSRRCLDVGLGTHRRTLDPTPGLQMDGCNPPEKEEETGKEEQGKAMPERAMGRGQLRSLLTHNLQGEFGEKRTSPPPSPSWMCWEPPGSTCALNFHVEESKDAKPISATFHRGKETAGAPRCHVRSCENQRQHPQSPEPPGRSPESSVRWSPRAW